MILVDVLAGFSLVASCPGQMASHSYYTPHLVQTLVERLIVVIIAASAKAAAIVISPVVVFVFISDFI